MEDEIRTEVLIVGGGPVGLTLAIDLAQRGVGASVVETRGPGEPPGVRCNHVAARTMETFRRLGMAQAVRNTGLTADYQMTSRSARPQSEWRWRAF
jgi:2-polyprenyl-6-methoxyphenol hydroxylase-like FAD-dependent oxidoreductase